MLGARVEVEVRELWFWSWAWTDVLFFHVLVFYPFLLSCNILVISHVRLYSLMYACISGGMGKN